MHLNKPGRTAAPSAAALTLLLAAILPLSTALSQTPGPRSTVVSASHITASPRPLTDQYCVMCHNQKALTGGVSLEGVDFSDAAANASLMERVLRKISSGEMPPAGMPRPTETASTAFTKSLEDTLDKAAAA